VLRLEACATMPGTSWHSLGFALFVFLVVLGFELGALRLLGRCS
jgi:hypothetical protein